MTLSRSKNLLQLSVVAVIAIALNACAVVDKRQKAQVSASGLFADDIDSTVSIVAVGDIMMGGKGKPVFEKEGYDYAFQGTRHLLQNADIVIGNLETALTDRRQPFIDKAYRFRNPPEKVATALKVAGFDIVSLANNHSMDYGEQGLVDTLNALDSVGIRYHGAGINLQRAREAVIFNLANKQTVGFLAYSNTFPEEFWASASSAGAAFGHEHFVKEDVARLVQTGVDIIVVSFHWGRERITALRPYQPLLAHAAIDAGADLVIGHHPHILQAIERYKDGLILYSLGNYTFSSFSDKVDYSAVANVEFQNGRPQRLVMTPIDINNFRVQLVPQVLGKKEALNVYRELKEISEPYNIDLQMTNEGGISWERME